MTDEIPEKWESGIGETGRSYYDKWFYHQDDEYELHIYWDDAGEHHVELIPIHGFHENGDPEYGYSQECASFETGGAAERYAFELMEKYA